MNLQEVFDDFCIIYYNRKYKMTDNNLLMFFKELVHIYLDNDDYVNKYEVLDLKIFLENKFLYCFCLIVF